MRVVVLRHMPQNDLGENKRLAVQLRMIWNSYTGFMDGIPKSSISFNERFNFNEHSQCRAWFPVNCVLSFLCHYPLPLSCLASSM